jgi:hypothetical protein
VHLVVDDVPGCPEVNGVNDLVVAVIFIAIEVGRLTAVAGVVEKERVVRLRVFDKPVHGSDDIRFRGLAHGILLIVGQNNHVLSFVSEMLVQVGRHVLRIVNAASELAALAEVVDADEERFPPSGTSGILECVALGRAVSEVLGLRWWRWGRIVITLHVSIAADTWVLLWT